MSAKGVDSRSDIWSLGIVAYQSLTGKLPFDGETVGALAVAINDGIYPAPSELRPGIPAAVDAWFKKVLVKKPEQRFQDAREMAKALEEAVGPMVFAEAETSVSPTLFDDDSESGAEVRLAGKPLETDPDAIPTSPVVDNAGVASPALAHTHLTATFSKVRQKPNALVLGVVAGVSVFVGIGLLIVALASNKRPPGEVLPATPAPTETTPAASVSTPVATPVVQPQVDAGAPIAAEALPTATPTKKKPPTVKPQVTPVPKPQPSSTSKQRKERGF